MSLFLFYSAPVGRGTRTASACSFYPGGSSFLHRLRGGTSCVSNTPLMGGRFSLNLSGGGELPRPAAGGKRVDTCGFPPLAPLNAYISKALIRMVVKNQLNQGFADSRQTVLL